MQEQAAYSKREAELRDGPAIVPIQLAHFVLQTSRFDEMLTWYLAVLNARISYQNKDIAFLTYDEEHHRVALVRIPGLKDKEKNAAGLFHTAFTYRGLDELLATYSRLKALDIMPAIPINHGPTTSIYYTDPDGNMVELQVENFATAEEAQNFMISEEFSENPIGVEFDPEDFLKRLRAGESEASLKKRPRIGPRCLADVKVD